METKGPLVHLATVQEEKADHGEHADWFCAWKRWERTSLCGGGREVSGGLGKGDRKGDTDAFGEAGCPTLCDGGYIVEYIFKKCS